MADRPPPSQYPTMHWSSSNQHYPTSSSYSPTSYQHNDGLAHPAYSTDPRRADTVYQRGYYSAQPPLSHSESPGTHHYPSQGLYQPPASQRPSHSHSHSQSHIHAHSPYDQVHSQSQPHYAQMRPRSHSQAPPYIQAQANPIMIPQHSPSHYQPPQAISISPQYPATPARPFSCDLCALSFNRQHDLKRHRETHTGEKPYLCNGGCGKTFTRKDALKRHQLVKGCGKADEAWP